MFRSIVFTVFACLLLAASAVAQVSDSTFHPHVRPALEVSRRTAEITIDGDIGDPGWEHAAKATDFTQAFPYPEVKPPVTTRTMVTYDDEYFYIAMVADDPDPSQIRASKVGRDNVSDNDFMGIILDTYGDGTRAFEIYANPLGIQEDLFWSGNNEDGSYDLVYQSEAKITATGWQLEMKIPFRSLRFPDRPTQHFHATFWRSYPREKTYKMSWASMNFQIPCVFCQLGTLTGIDNIHSSGSLELLPTLVASQDAFHHDDKANLVNDKVAVSPSLGVRYALGTATALEVALNPDFSQVESDATQISANTTLALFYPEHRPFFQDGSDLLNTDISAVYTRSINSPIAAAKAIIRDDATSFSYIGAVDEHSPMLIPLEERTIVLPDVGRSFSNILRAVHSFGDNRTIGALATLRNFEHNGAGGVFGLDAKAQLFENVEAAAQTLYSITNEQTIDKPGLDSTFGNNRHSVALDGEHFAGAAGSLTLQRFTPTLDVQLSVSSVSPMFRAANGFITANAYRSFVTFTGYKFYFPNQSPSMRWLDELDFSISTNLNVNTLGERKLFAVRPDIDVSIIGQTNLHCSYRYWNERFHGIEFQNLGYIDFFGNSRPAEWLSFDWDIKKGTAIARFLATPIVANAFDMSVNAKFKPVAGLLIEPNYAFERLDSEDGSTTLISGAIYRAKVTYQFSRELSARVIVQYDEFGRALQVDPLITYQLDPFSSVYLGSSHDYASFDPNVQTLYPSERHFFAKLQYLIQS